MAARRGGSVDERARTHTRSGAGSAETQGYCVTLGWRRSDLELILRGLVSEAAPYDLISCKKDV